MECIPHYNGGYCNQMAGPGPSLSYPSVIMVYALREMEKEGVGELGRSVIEKRDTKNNCKLLPMEI